MTSQPTIETALPSAVDMALFDALETAPPVSLAHQHMLVFVKGDGKAAARRLNTESP